MKNRNAIVVALLFSMIGSFIICLSLYFRERRYSKEEKRFYYLMERFYLFQNHIKQALEDYRLLAGDIACDSRIVTAVTNREKTVLGTHLKEMSNLLSGGCLSFYDYKGRLLIRGVVCNSPSLKERIKVPLSEVCGIFMRGSDLLIQVIVPVKMEGTIVGAISISRDINQSFLNEIKKKLGVDISLFVDNQRIITTLSPSPESALINYHKKAVSKNFKKKGYYFHDRYLLFPLWIKDNSAANICGELIASTTQSYSYFHDSIFYRLLRDGLLLWAILFFVSLAVAAFCSKDTDQRKSYSKSAEEEVAYLSRVYQQMAKSFKDQSNEMETILRSVPDGVFITSPEGRIKLWNKGAENITGFLQEEAKNFLHYMDMLKLQTKSGEALNIDYVSKAVEQKIPVSSEDKEIYLLNRQGYRVPIIFSATPIMDEEDNVILTVQIIRDISKQKEIEKLKEDFMAMITHDLKSPLSAIMGYAKLLQNNKVGSDEHSRQNYINSMLRCGKSLLVLIDNLLESARFESGKMTLHMEHFQLKNLVSEAEEMLLPLAEYKDITISSRINKGIWVFGDVEKLREVFVNLISNGIKFTPKGGKIYIGADLKENMVEVTVRDTGKGISAEDIPNLFQKFAQRKGEKVGTGLGLYIVKVIVEAHRGNIELSSKVGSGTKFTFTLPRGMPITLLSRR